VKNSQKVFQKAALYQGTALAVPQMSQDEHGL
jgi:hypothetical protein